MSCLLDDEERQIKDLVSPPWPDGLPFQSRQPNTSNHGTVGEEGTKRTQKPEGARIADAMAGGNVHRGDPETLDLETQLAASHHRGQPPVTWGDSVETLNNDMRSDHAWCQSSARASCSFDPRLETHQNLTRAPRHTAIFPNMT